MIKLESRVEGWTWNEEERITIADILRLSEAVTVFAQSGFIAAGSREMRRLPLSDVKEHYDVMMSSCHSHRMLPFIHASKLCSPGRSLTER